MDINDLTYEQAFARLEEIADSMGSASIPLDDLMKLYEEGMELASFCEKKLKSYDTKLEMISARVLQAENEKETEDELLDDIDDGEAPF